MAIEIHDLQHESESLSELSESELGAVVGGVDAEASVSGSLFGGGNGGGSSFLGSLPFVGDFLGGGNGGGGSFLSNLPFVGNLGGGGSFFDGSFFG